MKIATIAKKVAKDAAKIAKQLGDKVVKELNNAVSNVKAFLGQVQQSAKVAMARGTEALKLLKSKMDPEKLLDAVKPKVLQFRKAFEKHFSSVVKMLDWLGRIEIAYTLIVYGRKALEAVVDWIEDALTAHRDAQSCKALSKGSEKSLKSGRDDLKKVCKELDKLKPA